MFARRRSPRAALAGLAIVVGGVVTGLLAGLFGVGGGAIIVPVLYEVFRILGVPEAVHMQLCIGTSLAIILPTTIRSYLTHREKGLVVPRVIRLWALPAVIGVSCGAAIAAFAPPAVFKFAFVLLALFDCDRNFCLPATAGISAPICPARCR